MRRIIRQEPERISGTRRWKHELPLWYPLPMLPLRQLALLGLGVALLHAGAFFGTAALMEGHGASMPAMIAKMDQIEYMQLADTMLSAGRFALWPTAAPEIFRTPGYPVLIALIDVFTGHWYWALFCVHALMVGILAMVVALIGSEIGLSRRLALLAGTLIGISSGPLLLTITGTGSDIMYTLLYALAAYTALQRAMPLTQKAVLVGLMLGIATLTRPVGVLASLPLLLGFALLSATEWRRYARATLLAGAAWLIVLAPWYARNASIVGTPILSTVSTFNITCYNIPMNETFWRGTGEDEAQLAVLQAVGTTTPEALRGITYLSAMQAYDSAYLRSHVFEYGVFHVYRTIPFFVMSGFNVANAIVSHEAHTLRVPLFPTEGDNLTRHIAAHEWAAVVGALGKYWFTTFERLSWLIAILLAFGAPLVARGARRRALLLFATIIAFNILLVSPVTQARYRVPTEPFIWVAAVYTGAALWKRYWEPNT